MNAPVPLSGDFLDGDDIPETLIPILQTQCRDQFPDVLDVMRRNSAWLRDNPGGSIPRFPGMHSFRTGSAVGERVVSSFSQWMFQRPLAHYRALSGRDRAAADSLLERIGGLEALRTRPEHWLSRRPGQLELVEGIPPSGTSPGAES